jgi:cation:H+ antiporter
MLIPVLSILGGFIVLGVGGEFLVRGATKLAALAGVSSLVIGLTVVAYGTSAPELIVTSYASLQGKADIAIGNVAGSNLFNVLLILGVCGTLAPLLTSRQLVRRDLPVMVGASLAFFLVCWDGVVQSWEGALLVAGAVAYSVHSIVVSRREQAAESRRLGVEPTPPATAAAWATSGGLVVLGLAALVLGGRLLVDGATAVARALGVSEAIIALTIVSAGTSLPEVAASVVATVRGERDIAIGNVVGSNTFNVLLILGTAGVVSHQGLSVSPAMLAFDIPLAVVVAIVAWALLATQLRLDRWEGGLLLGGYVAYVTYLVLVEIHSPALGPFVAVMAYAILPLAALAVTVSLILSLWQARRARPE